VDSVLVADLPLEEAEPFVDAARRAAVAPIFIAPPNVPPDRLARIAAHTQGYTYVTTRPGVTGEDRHEYGDLADRLATLRRLGAPPSLLGFGVSRPSQVRSALSAGAAGVIVGSAMVRRAAETGAAALLDVFVRELKEATRPTQARPRPAGGALR
jgi:tryptophan synthase alpha chain